MVSNSLLLLLLLAGTATLWGVIEKLTERRVRRSRLSGREDLTIGEIYRRYYSSSAFSRDVVEQEWSLVAELLNVPAGQLRPGDPLAWLATLGPSVTSDVDDLEAELCGRPTSVDEARHMELKTVDDAVRYLMAHPRTDNAAH